MDFGSMPRSVTGSLSIAATGTKYGIRDHQGFAKLFFGSGEEEVFFETDEGLSIISMTRKGSEELSSISEVKSIVSISSKYLPVKTTNENTRIQVDETETVEICTTTLKEAVAMNELFDSHNCNALFILDPFETASSQSFPFFLVYELNNERDMFPSVLAQTNGFSKATSA